MLDENQHYFFENITSIHKPLLLLRPDGFGKSYFLHKLEHFFVQKKIPVLALHLGERRYETELDLDCVIQAAFQTWERIFHIPHLSENLSEGERLARCMLAAEQSTGKKCAILIDDYDFPLLSENDNSLLHYENALSSLYGALSTHSDHFQFALLLGATRQEKLLKFAKPRDISFDSDFSGATGFFETDVKKLLEKKEHTDLSLPQLTHWYGGYHFGGNESVFCAKSIISALENDSVGIYFPAKLFVERAVEKVILSHFDFSVLLQRFGIEATDEVFFDFDLKKSAPLSFLFQFGFLTKQIFDKQFGTNRLCFPNRETRAAFFAETARRLTSLPASESRMWAIDAIRFLENDDLRTFFASANTALRAVTPKSLKSALTTLFGLISIYTDCIFEDGFFIIETPSFLHIIAFDLVSMQNAFERLYHRTFQAGKKLVRKTGVLLSADSGIISWRTL